MRDQKLWTLHMAAGGLIFVFLGLHMAIMHLDGSLGLFNPAGGHPVDWGNVAARGRSLVFTVTYVALLGAALFHGLYGLRNILFEVTRKEGARRVINWGLTLAGLGVFVLGTWAAWAGHMVALAA